MILNIKYSKILLVLSLRVLLPDLAREPRRHRRERNGTIQMTLSFSSRDINIKGRSLLFKFFLKTPKNEVPGLYQ